METFLLFIHNLLRWAVLLAAFWALFAAYRGWMAKLPWSPGDKRRLLIFAILLDTQVLLGGLLFIISPVMRGALAHVEIALKTPAFRFFLLEHAPLMLIALVVTHFTSSRVRKGATDVAKHRSAAIGVMIVLGLIIFAIPWFRPLLPWLR